MNKQEKIKFWCEFLDEMANWLESQDTKEDAQFWANSHNAEVLREIRRMIEIEIMVL